MSTGTPYIGTKISLISKAEIRYEGILYAIDTKNATVTLANVRSFGTEDRQTEKKIPPRDEVYEYIVFRGQDIKDLHVCEAPTKQLPQDPAIVQSGGIGLPSAGYSHFHTPVTYPQAPSYGPFSGLPSYSSYPPGIQQPFADRQVPGHIHPGMVGPLFPQRIPTPPPAQPMPLSRSHTPSPETILPVLSPSNPGEVKMEETPVKTTSQQGTQTVQPKRRSSRSSSRRNSEDRTQTVQEKKKQESKDNENPVRDSDTTKPSTENQKPQQGSSRRSQGRRGTSSARGTKGRSGSVKFDGEFDFESSNAKFKKEEVEEELQQKLNENLRITDEVENTPNVTMENEIFHEKPQSPLCFYDGTKSFFDSISCEANDRDRNRRAHPSWQQERKVNMETFGISGGMRRGGRGRGRGRGRGGSRGGRGGSRSQGRGGNSGWRSGRGTRGNRSKTWVDYTINASDGLPTNIQNGPSTPEANTGATAKA